MRTPILAGSILTLVTLLAGAAARADVKVGVTAAVNPQAIGQPPTEAERVLLVGTDNFANEKITTGPGGQLQLLFVDGSSISVGPDANLTIDQYVYDPNTKSGKLAVSAAQGVFRLVGGAISKASEVTITTPTMTAGIRGGIALISSRPNQPSTAAFLFGSSMRVTANGVTQEATRPGFQITVLPGQPPSPPVRITSAELRNSLGNFQGRRSGGGQAGGQTGAPGGGGGETQVDTALAQSNVSSATGSNQPPQTFGLNTAISNVNNPSVVNALQNVITQAANRTTTETAIANAGSAATGTPLFGHFYAEPLFATFTPSSGNATYNTNSSVNVQYAVTGSGSSQLIAFKLPSDNGQTQSFALPFMPGSTYSTGAITLLGGGTASGTAFVTPDSMFFSVLGKYTPPSGQTCSGGQTSCSFGMFGGKPTQSTASSPFPNTSTSTGATGFATYGAIGLSTEANRPVRLPFSGGLNTPTPGQVGVTVSPMYTVFGGTMQPGSPAASTNLQASLWIVGTGANQFSGMVGTTATFFQEQNSTVAFAGGTVGMTRDCAGCVLNRYASSATSAPIAPTPGSGLTNGNAIYGPNANYMVITTDNSSPQQNAADTRTSAAAQVIPFNTAQSLGPEFSGTFLSQATFSTTTFAPRTDTTPSSPTGNYRGYTGGVMDVRSTTGAITQAMFTTNINSGFSFIGTNPNTNQLGAVFNFRDVSTNDQYSLQFGANNNNFGTRNAFINDQIFGARDSRDINGNPLSTLNGSLVPFNRLFMVSYNVAPIDFQTFAGTGVTACTCEFMRWGWWIGEVQNSNGVRERFQLATWVAGVLPTNAEIAAQTGIGVYNGHAIGNVAANNFNYIAAGKFAMSWDFGAHSGNWNVTQFDKGGVINSSGIAFGGTVSGTGNSWNGINTISGPNGSTGSAWGSFFKNGNVDPAGGVGGSWSLSNSAFKAAGTFLGRR